MSVENKSSMQLVKVDENDNSDSGCSGNNNKNNGNFLGLFTKEQQSFQGDNDETIVSPSIYNNGEVAYVLLEDTEIIILSSSNSTEQLLKNDNMTSRWIDVQIIMNDDDVSADATAVGSSSTERCDDENDKSCHSEPPQKNDDNDDKPCAQCHLVLSAATNSFSNSSDKNELQCTSLPSFDGTMSDISQCLTCQQRQRRRTNHYSNRSDAALLVGAAITSHQSSFVHISNFQIFLHCTNSHQDNLKEDKPTRIQDKVDIKKEEDDHLGNHHHSTCDSKNEGEKIMYCAYRASIVLTFSLPQININKKQSSTLSSSKLSKPNNSLNSSNNNTTHHGTHNSKKIDGGKMTIGQPISNEDSLLSDNNDNNNSPAWKKRKLSPNQQFHIHRKSSTKNHVFNMREMPPCAELIYTLFQSDWNSLDQKMKQIMNYYAKNKLVLSKKNKKQTNQFLFPKKLTLEDLYNQIQGAAIHVDQFSHNHKHLHNTNGTQLTKEGGETSNSQTMKTEEDMANLNVDEITLMKENDHYNVLLPDEIWVTKIAPFLRAKSLDSIRCTCRYYHSLLKSVVPGMKLNLFQHQIKSLQWMRRRECQQISEGDILQNFYRHSSSTPITSCILKDTVYQSISGGITVSLNERSTTTSGDKNQNKKWQIDTRTGKIIRESSNHKINDCTSTDTNLISPSLWARKVARGGLLCDDPGLGKTITVLSLILQTLGLETKMDDINDIEGKDEEAFGTTNDNIFASPSSSRQGNHRRIDDNSVFDIYWKEGSCPLVRQMDMYKLISKLRRSDRYAYYFENPVDQELDNAPDYNKIIKIPICMRDILDRINLDRYGKDFQSLCRDVNLVFRNAMLYNDHCSVVYQAAERMKQRFDMLVEEFKSQTVFDAKRKTSLGSRQSDSPVAAALTERAKQELLDALHPSAATLLVVPNTLLNHWEEQIEMHVDLAACAPRKKTPLIYRHQLRGAIKKGENPLNGVFETCDASLAYCLCAEEGSHYPFLFIDENCTSQLPEPRFLAMFHIFLTTSQRMTLEWKNGNVQDELRCSTKNPRKSIRLDNFRCFSDEVTFEACPLLKVHWLRLIVDEGHSMGKRSQNNSIQFASWITAQRRWVMTGTPTPQTASQNGLRNILGLLKFLQHDHFSPRFDGDRKWKLYISKQWNDLKVASFFRMKSLLSYFMVRHTKEDIEELPKPIFSHTYIDLSANEIMAYNTLVSAVQANIITTSMEGKTSAWQDSLFNPRQAKFARQALDNIRLTCCGGTSVVPQLSQKNWDETIEFLRDLHKVNEVRIIMVKNFLHRVVTEQLSSCMCCGMQLQTLFVLPCADLICTECIDNSTKTCPVCDKAFDVDDFQRLQPGLSYNWKWNIEEAKRERDRIIVHQEELSHVNHTNNNNNNNDRRVINRRQRQPIQRRRVRSDHECVYPTTYTDGKCTICGEVHRECVFVNPQSKCFVCHASSEHCPKHESKAYYVTNKLLELFLSDEYRSQNIFQFSSAASRIISEDINVESRRPLKVIIFSQFRQILNVVGDRLLRRLGGGCVAEYWGATRGLELEKFAKSPDCICMLLGNDGSHGLDLSFVTHIFFLDEIWDKSVESQVVARAYRMGATGCVKVMQLVARNSVEEMMVNMNKGNSKKKIYEDDDDDISNNNRNDVSPVYVHQENTTQRSRTKEEKTEQRAKMYYLLKNVKFMKVSTMQSQKDRKVHGNEPVDQNQLARKVPNQRVRFSQFET